MTDDARPANASANTCRAACQPGDWRSLEQAGIAGRRVGTALGQELDRRARFARVALLGGHLDADFGQLLGQPVAQNAPA